MGDYLGAIEIIAEQRIREAQAKGEFDGLPGQGRPLKLEDLTNVPPELRMVYKILKNAGLVPEELSQRKELITLTALLDSCEDEQQKTAAISRLRYLVSRMQLGAKRHAALEAQDEYYQKALSKLEQRSREKS